jgi:23S rRNA (cytidine1920-2'-O)/16S rRNA (cytidine1409-2'-O)-methyltransferase
MVFMSKQRLDQVLVLQKLAESRSQAENLIKLGEVQVDGVVIKKPGYFMSTDAKITITASERYVSRAGLKLASVANIFNLDFNNKVVLDVGSSTGGFTDFALQHGAQKVVAVDVGTDQLHPSLHGNDKIELHEQTDIRDIKVVSETPDIVVIDVSFISLREILPHVATLCTQNTLIAAMLKPQFEAGANVKHKGVIKNDRMRREILQDFEAWAKQRFLIKQKADSGVAGTKGNQERFYLLKPLV